MGGLINHIELTTWGKQLLKTMNIPKGATIDGTSNGIALLVGGQVYLSMGGGGCVLLLPAGMGENRSEWLLGVQGYIRLWADGWKRSEGLLWLLRGIYGLFLLPVVGWKYGEGVVEILKHAAKRKSPHGRGRWCYAISLRSFRTSIHL